MTGSRIDRDSRRNAALSDISMDTGAWTVLFKMRGRIELPAS
jgi:hypothetical protein